MIWADLRDLFAGLAWKRLSAHEVDPAVSHGHEFQGVNELRRLLGETPRRFTVTYMLLDGESDGIESIRSEAQWYDSRANQPHRSAEWRLYYPADVWQIQARMHAGDLLVLALLRDQTVVVMLAPAASTTEAELESLFSIRQSSAQRFNLRTLDRRDPIGLAAASILEKLGLSLPEKPEGDDVDTMRTLAGELSRSHPLALPSGQQVSALVRSRLARVDSRDDPDAALVRWIEAEEAMFRMWEDAVIGRRLTQGFVEATGEADVEAFRTFSMSLRQSRVARAGGALEDHAARIFEDHKIRFDRKPSIDGGEKPDFLFPGKSEYDDMSFEATRLRMLGAKFTAKDRWRQVLAEASRVWPKHLLTLESPISDSQVTLMAAARLQLIVPTPRQQLYSENARTKLCSLQQFLLELRRLQ